LHEIEIAQSESEEITTRQLANPTILRTFVTTSTFSQPQTIRSGYTGANASRQTGDCASASGGSDFRRTVNAQATAHCHAVGISHQSANRTAGAGNAENQFERETGRN
jgi:hypothetical protein